MKTINILGVSLPTKQEVVDALNSGEDVSIIFNGELGLALVCAIVRSAINAHHADECPPVDITMTIRVVGG